MTKENLAKHFVNSATLIADGRVIPIDLTIWNMFVYKSVARYINSGDLILDPNGDPPNNDDDVIWASPSKNFFNTYILPQIDDLNNTRNNA